MSYVAIATGNYDAMVRFYGEVLGFPTLDAWDRPGARGRRLDLGGLTLELLDASREARPLDLPGPGDRVQVVIEVPDIDAAHRPLGALAPAVQTHFWGARTFRLRDPDGTAVVFLQWLDRARAPGS